MTAQRPDVAEPRVRLVRLPATALAALMDGDLGRASELVGLELPEFYLGEDWLWRIRLDQIRADPAVARWLVRAVATMEDVVVGHAGFHGPPDARGMVEVAYTIVPEQRGRGYAKSALAELLTVAASEPDVRTVRASIGPDNEASLAIVRSFGFRHVDEQWDEQDGRELLFERPA